MTIGEAIRNFKASDILPNIYFRFFGFSLWIKEPILKERLKQKAIANHVKLAGFGYVQKEKLYITTVLGGKPADIRAFKKDALLLMGDYKRIRVPGSFAPGFMQV